MSKQILIINGDNFSDLETFFYEIDRVLTKDLEWKTGHNFDAFNDLLRGGFGVHEYEEAVKLMWTKFSLSQSKLGYELVADLVAVIKQHEHIEFIKTD